MAKFLDFRASGMFRKMAGRVQAGKSVLDQPLAEDRGDLAVKLLRFSRTGIRDQFTATTEYRNQSVIPWRKGHDFGTHKAGKVMLGQGNYRSAWLGGTGEKISRSGNTVFVGVEEDAFPQVAIHQGDATFRTIKPRVRTKSGNDWKMRFYLGLTYGVWMTKARLEKGLTVFRRRVSLSSEVKNTIRQMVKNQVKAKMSKGAA